MNLPNRSGDYQQPPIKNPTVVAANAAHQFIFASSIPIFMAPSSLSQLPSDKQIILISTTYPAPETTYRRRPIKCERFLALIGGQ